MTARQAAVTVLLRVQEQGGYSNVVLDEWLEKSALTGADRAMAARLVYGVTERRLTIDYLLNHTSSTPVKKMTPAVREILRVGAYQLVYMDKTPAFAAINESVELTRIMGQGRLTGFVNAVLRQVERTAKDLLHALPATDKGLELRYSCPRAWIRLWRQAYGEDTMQGLLSSLQEAPPAYIRVNTLRTTTAQLADCITAAGGRCTMVEGLPAALCVSPASVLQSLPSDIQTHYYFQDLASQWACRALEPRAGERIADVCAAPGGKTMTVAQEMGDTGCIVAGDIHGHKCRAMTERVSRYGISSITVTQKDAAALPDESLVGTFDRVICDAPCSGLGVIRRKPEIRYKSPEEFADLPGLQLQILNSAAQLVRPGGVLQYSTCTLRPEENEQVAAAFLEQNPAFVPRILPLDLCFEQAGTTPSHMLTLFPHIHGTDGFFIAAFSKIHE